MNSPPPSSSMGRAGTRKAVLSVRDLTTKTVTVGQLDVGAGEAVTVLGASGSGKSLLLRAIADLDPNDANVSLDGIDRNDMPAPAWRRQVGFLAAESGWWAETVGPHFRDQDAARVLLERLGFDEGVFSWSINRLSTGEKQRLALVRLLSGAPNVLLLDEPTGALDQDSAARVEEIITQRVEDGCAAIIVTHDRGQAERLANRHYEIVAGALVATEAVAA